MSNDPEAFIKKAKTLVVESFNNDFPIDHVTRGGEDKDFYVVWFAKTLGNWKALVSTDLLPGQYWEVTYNGAKQETYVDHYEKVSNVAVPDSVRNDSSISQDRAERAEFRAEVHKTAEWAVKALKEGGHDNTSIATELGISEAIVRTLLISGKNASLS